MWSDVWQSCGIVFGSHVECCLAVMWSDVWQQSCGVMFGSHVGRCLVVMFTPSDVC